MAGKRTNFQKTQLNIAAAKTSVESAAAQAQAVQESLRFFSPRDGSHIATAVPNVNEVTGFVISTVSDKPLSLQTLEALAKWAKQLAAKK